MMTGIVRACVWGVVVALTAAALGVELTWRVLALLVVASVTEAVVDAVLPYGAKP